MRSHVRKAAFIVALSGAAVALAGCSSTGSDAGGSGLSQSFDMSNYRRSNDTNGTQTRPDVNRAYTQPTLPSIANRGL